MRNIEIGDIVKSLDFAGHDDCYYIGKVVGVFEDGTFRAESLARVWLHESERKFADYFTAPLPGNHLMDDKFERVKIIGHGLWLGNA